MFLLLTLLFWAWCWRLSSWVCFAAARHYCSLWARLLAWLLQPFGFSHPVPKTMASYLWFFCFGEQQQNDQQGWGLTHLQHNLQPHHYDTLHPSNDPAVHCNVYNSNSAVLMFEDASVPSTRRSTYTLLSLADCLTAAHPSSASSSEPTLAAAAAMAAIAASGGAGAPAAAAAAVGAVLLASRPGRRSSSTSVASSSCCCQCVPALEPDISAQQQQELEAVAPPEFLCPLGRLLMTDPVFTPSGFTYHRPCIVDFILRTGRDPARDSPLSPEQLCSNINLRDQVATWLQQRGVQT